jgi:hypothetical protein
MGYVARGLLVLINEAHLCASGAHHHWGALCDKCQPVCAVVGAQLACSDIIGACSVTYSALNNDMLLWAILLCDAVDASFILCVAKPAVT